MLTVKGTRIENRLNALSRFGENAAGGISRPAFSDADIAGRQYIRGLMKKAALSVETDTAGNMIGRKEGRVKSLPAIALGSHIDTVIDGGMMELHVEQGAILEKNRIDIGVVEGIVGIRHWDVYIEGVKNHAGTTPMDLRKDALVAASHFVIEVNEIARRLKGNQVATIGVLDIQSPAANVVPGHVELVLEIRDVSDEKICQVCHEIEKASAMIEQNTGTHIRMAASGAVIDPALMDGNIKSAISGAAKELGYRTLSMLRG